jgi:hypothetical protein
MWGIFMENLLIVRTYENSVVCRDFLIEYCKDKDMLENISMFTKVNSG